MSDCEDKKAVCRNIFLDGSAETTVERYTAAWIHLISQLEKFKNIDVDATGN